VFITDELPGTRTNHQEAGMAPTTGLVCPLCSVELAGIPTDRCPGCRGDLRPLRRIGELADHHFNAAVQAARARRWGVAAEHLAVTLALAPDDVDALVLLGKVRWHEGQRENSRSAWKEALRLDPNRQDARAGVAHSEAALANAASQTRSRARSRDRRSSD
jgi:tetratricopeptide (TPR) repeat protein